MSIDEELPEGAIDFNSFFQSYSEANEKEWKYDRRASLGASEVFQCLRKSFFEKWGYEPDDNHEDDWGAAKRGDIIEENFFVPGVLALLKNGEQLEMAGKEQETLRKGRLSATPDGLVTGAARTALAQLGIDDILSDCFVTECKSHDPRADVKQEKAVHRGQVQVQMGLIRELTDYKPEYAVIFYFDASWLSKISFFVIRFDPKVYEAAKKRAEIVFTDQDPENVPAEGLIDDTCDTCKFHEECAIASKRAIPSTKRKIEDPAILDELAALASKRAALDRAKKDAEADLKQINALIKDTLKKYDTKGAGDDRFNISLTWCKGKKSTDLLAMQQDGIDVESYQNEGVGYEMLRVTTKGQSNE
jgi:hypothetical protein